MMPIPENYQKLVGRLRRLTSEERLRWIKGSNKYEYFVAFENMSVRINDVGEEEEDTEFELSVINSKGESIDSFTLKSSDGDFKYLFDIFRGARVEALGVKKALDELDSVLDEIEKGERNPPEGE